VALFYPGTRRERATRTAALLLPLCIAWFVGWWAYGPQSHSLEEQVDVRSLYHIFDPENPLLAMPWSYPSRYIWGHSPPWEIPMTLRFMYLQASIPAPEEFMRWQSGGRDVFYGGWFRVASASAAMCLLVLGRHRWRLWGLFCTTFPFLVSLHGVSNMAEFQLRFIATGMPALAVIMGVAFAGLAALRLPYRGAPSSLRAVGVVAVLVCVVGGVLPTWLHPTASWRQTWHLEQSDLSKLMDAIVLGSARQPQAWEATCIEGLTEHMDGRRPRFRAYEPPDWLVALRSLSRVP